MRPPQMKRHSGAVWLLVACLSLGAPLTAFAQNEPGGAGNSGGAAAQPAQASKPSLEVYGFVMLDFGENFTPNPEIAKVKFK